MFTLQTLIPEIIIILALAGIIMIAAKKFPEVAKIKVENKNKEKSLFQKAGKSIIDFSVSVAKAVFARIANLKNLKDKIKKEEKKDVDNISRPRQELRKLILNRPKSKPKVLPIAKTETKSPISLRAKAELLTGKKEYKEAEKVYLELIKKDPRDIVAYKGLGKIYFIQQILSDAQSAYEQAVKLNPDDLESQTEIYKIRNLKKDLSIRGRK
ncbi:MAG: hypothetical protein WC663_01890 [Patescibacteria group bacterium]|jgi:tetratricopeptide (TPR) repeat protein